MLQRSKALTSLGVFFLCFHSMLFDTADADNSYNSSCSHVFREVAIKVYDNNFDNFNKVIDLVEVFSSDVNNQADLLIGLFEAMDTVHHITDPLKALPLYNEVEALINNSSNAMHPFQANDLEKRYIMLTNAIIDHGSEILEAGVILNDCNSANSTVQVLLNELYLSNETLSDLTVSKMAWKVRWLLPFEELLVTAGNISTHVRQNIDVMLALHNAEYPTGQDQILYFFQLSDMQQDPNYNATVSAEKKREVDRLTPVVLKYLIAGEVCLNLQLDNGTKLFVYECSVTNRACLREYHNERAILKVVIKRNPFALNFLSKNYGLRPLHINPNEPNQPNGLKYDVYSSVDPNASNDWQIELDGDYLKVHNGTRLLCGSSPLAFIGNERQAYSRPIETYEKYTHECRWTVSNCKGV